jgi:diguanylate cyclase (GGDEF)-like protein/PAS domain S-box-containing protein
MGPGMNVWILVAGLGLVLMTWFPAYHLVRQEHADAVRRTRQVQANICKGMETHLADMLNDIDLVLLLIKSDYEKNGAVSPTTRAILQSRSFVRFSRLAMIANEQGRVLLDFGPNSVGLTLDMSTQDYFQVHARQDTGKLFIGPSITGRISGQTLVPLSRRLNHPDGSFAGVVAMGINAPYFGELFQQTMLEPMEFLLLGTDAWVRAASEGHRDLIGRSVADSALAQSVADAAAGMILMEMPDRQGKSFVSFRAMEAYGLITAVAQKEADALEYFRERRRLYYGAAETITVLLLLFVYALIHANKRQHELSDLVQVEKERAEYYLNMAGSLLVALDLSGRVTMLNHRGAEILGYVEEDLIGKDWFETVVPPENRATVRSRFQQLASERLHSRNLSMEMEIVTRSGQRRMIAWISNVLKNFHGEVIGVLSAGVDVTERQRMEAELLRLANIDNLTGLSNRRIILEAGQRELEQYQRYHRPLSLFVLDIDHFKQVNDTYGHAAGDQVLIKLAEVSRRLLRTTDMCGRLGGEEFIGLLPETPVDQAYPVAERLRETLAETPVATPTGEIRFTVSIGIATAIADDKSIDDLIRVADEAMYEAKATGRNKVVVRTRGQDPG